MKKAFIISVPFYRIAKLTLSSFFLENISSKNVDILIVTPLNSPEFKKQFSQFTNVKFIEWHYPDLSNIERKIFAMSELLRRYGYWYKFRKHLLKYHFYNQFKLFGINGNDSYRGILDRFAIWIANILGSHEISWKYLDIVNFKSATFAELDRVKNNYDELVFIQSSSWAEQDRMLQKWVRKSRALNILFPYTTDQLWTNGYLLGRYDKIFLQGPVEYDFAVAIHKIPAHKLVKSGSVWFRVLDSAVKEKSYYSAGDAIKTIMYAGVAEEYYPKAAEFEILRYVNEAIKHGDIPKCSIVYRPYYRSIEERNHIESMLKDISHLTFQWMDIGLNEIQSSTEVSLEKSLIDTVDDFSNVDLLVMSGLTSIALDVAYLSKCAVIANFIDHQDILKKRKATFQLNPDKSVIGVPGCLVVETKNELMEALKYFLTNKDESGKQATSIYENWDYGNNKLLTIDPVIV